MSCVDVMSWNVTMDKGQIVKAIYECMLVDDTKDKENSGIKNK